MSTIDKEINSAIDASQNIVEVLHNLRGEIISLYQIKQQQDQLIEERDKIIAQQEQEIIDLKQQIQNHIELD